MLKELNRHAFSLVNIVKPGLLVFLSTENSYQPAFPLIHPTGINAFYAGKADTLRDTEVSSQSSKNYETFRRVSVLIATYDNLIF